MFITLEGAEGSGKTTQAQKIVEYLQELNLEALLTREPGGTKIGTEIRQVLLNPANTKLFSKTELLLYMADRSQHVEQVLRPALTLGKSVICDRYIHSTIAYQCYGRGINRALIDNLNALATGGLLPDLTIVLDLPVEEGLKRAAQRRAMDRMEQEEKSFHNKVRAGFLALAQENPKQVKLISALD